MCNVIIKILEREFASTKRSGLPILSVNTELSRTMVLHVLVSRADHETLDLRRVIWWRHHDMQSWDDIPEKEWETDLDYDDSGRCLNPLKIGDLDIECVARRLGFRMRSAGIKSDLRSVNSPRISSLRIVSTSAKSLHAIAKCRNDVLWDCKARMSQSNDS